MPDEGKVAREYLRVSMDRSGRERSIDEQHDENERAAQQSGWTLGEPYRDKGSASRYATRARGGYDRLLRDLDRDRFDADVLVLWESSRGSRTVGEWVRLVESCEQRSVLIHVTSHGRSYDPANPRDRRSLLEDAVDSEYESAKTSMRARRSAAANAAEGKPHGPVPYGYTRHYDPATRRFAGQEPEPSEAAVIRELFDRIQTGHSIRSVATDFERRGIRSRTGRMFSAQYLRWFLRNPRYAGLRYHVAGRRNGNPAHETHGELTEAQWPPLVDRASWLAVQRILTAPERKTMRPGRGVHLLSMIGRCEVCGGVIVAARSKTGEPIYRCRLGHVQVDKAALDDYAERVILGYLARPDNVERLTRRDDGAALADARRQVAEVRAELDDLADRVGRGHLSATFAARAEPAIQERLRAAQRRRDELSTPSVLRGLISPGKDVVRRWRAAPMSAKRTILRRLFVPDLIGELRVAPKSEPWVKVPVEERIAWRTS
jgi:DNA invertase Pin-like site-specific DNA recombinase